MKIQIQHVFRDFETVCFVYVAIARATLDALNLKGLNEAVPPLVAARKVVQQICPSGLRKEHLKAVLSSTLRD